MHYRALWCHKNLTARFMEAQVRHLTPKLLQVPNNCMCCAFADRRASTLLCYGHTPAGPSVDLRSLFCRLLFEGLTVALTYRPD